MTREEAIERLNIHKSTSVFVDSIAEAIDMAIEALQAVPNCKRCAIKELWEETEKEDLVAVVRCKDCRYRKKVGTSYYCELDEFNVKDADFCSWGERREP